LENPIEVVHQAPRAIALTVLGPSGHEHPNLRKEIETRIQKMGGRVRESAPRRIQVKMERWRPGERTGLLIAFLSIWEGRVLRVDEMRIAEPTLAILAEHVAMVACPAGVTAA
jgi:hypothetical protein